MSTIEGRSARRLNQSGLLFMPRRWQRANVLRWLKRTHAWTGFWGALLFLMMGISGFFLNHRDTMKIETGEPVEVSAMDIAVPAGSIADKDQLGRWAQREFGLTSEPREPRGKGGRERGGKREAVEGSSDAGGAARSGGEKRFLGKARPEAEKWELSFNHPNGRLTVEHVAGSASVAVRQEAQTPLGFIKNLHKGSGLGVAWVLFVDTIAGALVVMSLTGFLLWSRLHGSRLLGGGLVVGSFVVGSWAIWPHLL